MIQSAIACGSIPFWALAAPSFLPPGMVEILAVKTTSNNYENPVQHYHARASLMSACGGAAHEVPNSVAGHSQGRRDKGWT